MENRTWPSASRSIRVSFPGEIPPARSRRPVTNGAVKYCGNGAVGLRRIDRGRMTDTTDHSVTAADIDHIADRYVAVWNEPDSELRRTAVADLWASDAVELIEEAEFRGHQELIPRIAGAYKAFVESGLFAVTSANDARGHHDSVTVTIKLIPPAGDVAWAARVVLLLGEDGRIRSDHQLTGKELVLL